MHIDARKLPNNSIIQGDICIIGAGAAGISIALDWINTPYKVILLEGGGFEYDEKVQNLYKGKTTGQKYFPLKSSRLHYFGGTTGHWAGMCAPFDNVDFIKRDWVPNSGWPITRKDMDPFYERAQKKINLGPYNYDLSYWQKEESDFDPLPLDKNVIWNKMWQFCKERRFGKVYGETIKKAENIHLYTYANVTNIIGNEEVSNIKKVVIKNHEGKTHKVKAKNFIMACGAIQNARLLLASNSQAPQGLGNDNDVVGRYFMEHIETTTADLWFFKDISTHLYSWPINTDRITRAELAITEKIQIDKKILNGTLSLLPLKLGKHFKPRMITWQDEDPRKSAENMFSNWGEAAKIAEKDKDPILDRAYQMDIRIEQAPNPNSRVTLGHEKDALGVPRGNLNWELTALDKRSVRKINHLIAEQVGKAGIGRVQIKEFLRDENDNSFPDTTNGGWHHMGTTRMSDDPKKGVVNVNCQVHGISNLFVAGSGCYVTSGASNPTLTVVALSLRLSDHIKEQMKNPLT